MAQPPFLIDQLSIAPGEAGSRSIQRDAAAGALSFTDPAAGTLLLSQLAGLQNVGGVLIVGKSGAGAKYTTLSTALAAVPSNASRTNPYVILVMPGVYEEEVVLDKDGVVIFGLGYVKVSASMDDNTLTVQVGAGTTPKWAELHNLVLANSYDGKAALRVIGGAGSEVVENGITLRGCRLEATGAGGNRPVWANACGPLVFRDCVVPDNGLSLCLFQEVQGARFEMADLPAFQYRYDTSQDIPAGSVVGLVLKICKVGADSTLNPVFDLDLNGGGTVTLDNLVVVGNARVQGDQAVELTGLIDGDLSVLETAVLEVGRKPTGTVTVAGTAQYSSEFTTDTETFAGDVTKAIAFGYDMGTTDYDVSLELSAQPANDETPWITAKVATGFTIHFNTAQALDVGWTVRRR